MRKVFIQQEPEAQMSYNSFLSVIYLYVMGGFECSWYGSLDDILLFKRRPGMGTRAIQTGFESRPVTSLLHSFHSFIYSTNIY